jgi:hypothetical protein
MTDIIERECCAKAALYDDLMAEIVRLRTELAYYQQATAALRYEVERYTPKRVEREAHGRD